MRPLLPFAARERGALTAATPSSVCNSSRLSSSCSISRSSGPASQTGDHTAGLELGDQQLEVFDLDRMIAQCAVARDDHRLQRGDVTMSSGSVAGSACMARSVGSGAAVYKASVGRQVRSGLRQSMPSSSIESCAGVRWTFPQIACGQTKRPRSRRLANRHRRRQQRQHNLAFVLRREAALVTLSRRRHRCPSAARRGRALPFLSCLYDAGERPCSRSGHVLDLASHRRRLARMHLLPAHI